MKYVIVSLAIALLIVFGTTRTEAARQEAVKSQKAVNPKESDQVQHKILSFSLEGLTDRGAKKWDVKGQSAQAVSENEVLLDNIVAKAYGEEAEATITADKGIYDKSKNNVTLEQNVKATIESKAAFDTGLTDISDQLTGPSKTKNAAPKKDKKTKTIITCDGEVQFDYEKNQGYFDKNVKIVNEEGSIDADMITVFLDPATKRISQIVADGNVKIERGENTTYSDKATYIERERKILLTGKPRLVIYQEGGFEENFLEKK